MAGVGPPRRLLPETAAARYLLEFLPRLVSGGTAVAQIGGKDLNEFNVEAPIESRAERDAVSLHDLSEFFGHAFGRAQEPLKPDLTLREFLDLTKAEKSFVQALTSIVSDMPQQQQEVRILDLGCGRAPLLAKLYDLHVGYPYKRVECYGDRCRNFGRKIYYTALDRSIPSDVKLQHDKWSSCLRNCFQPLHWITLDVTSSEQFDTLLDNGPWDILVMSNTLHELPPASWAHLLARAPDMLADGGTLAIVDLSEALRFDYPLWQAGGESFMRRFWEAEGLWLSDESAADLIRATGLTLRAPPDGGGAGEYWVVKGTKECPSRSPFKERKEKMRECIVELLERRHASGDNLQKLREKTREVIQNLDDKAQNKQELIISALYYLCSCASCCYWDEASATV